MKRPLSVIGLVYLLSLAVVFHFYSTASVIIISVCAAVSCLCAVVFKLTKRSSTKSLSVIAASLAALAAILSIFLFEQFKVAPIMSDYSNREIYIEGYICDELSYGKNSSTCTVRTEKIDGEERDTKITCTLIGRHDLSPFDKIKARVTPKPSGYSYQLSKGIYLYATVTDSANFTATGEKHVSPYYYAVELRRKIKGIFDDSLDDNAAALSRAVLLGDKKALSYDVRKAFTDTGVSYLIVVSGMHLAIVTLILRKILRRFRVNKVVSFVLITVFILIFIAVTGFTPSVIRAGIMCIMIYLSKIPRREVDSFTSLGVAALVLTLPNPYAVGDVGMLLSFAATFGILLWANRIRYFLISLLHLKEKNRKRKPTFREKLRSTPKRAARSLISFLSTSLAATLWVIPVSVLFFGRIAPLTVLISLIAYPLTFAVLMLSLFFAVFGLFGVKLAPLVPLLNVLSGWLTDFVNRCSQLPMCCISADEGYFFVWIAVSLGLVALGYLIRAGKLYVLSAVIISVLTLSVGGSLTYIFADDSAELTIYRNGSGYTAAVQKNMNISLLSCGGTQRGMSAVIDRLSRADSIDIVVLPGKENRNFAYFGEIASEHDIANALMYKNQFDEELIDREDVGLFDDNTSFTLTLNTDVKVKVITVKNRVYQYVYSKDTSVLIIPEKAVLSRLPEEFRRADYAVLEGSAEGLELLDCEVLLSVSGKPVTSGASVETISDGGSYTIKFR